MDKIKEEPVEELMCGSGVDAMHAYFCPDCAQECRDGDGNNLNECPECGLELDWTNITN